MNDSFINYRNLGEVIDYVQQDYIFRSGEPSPRYKGIKNIGTRELIFEYIDLRSDEEVLRKPFPKYLMKKGLKYERKPIQNYDFELTMTRPNSEDYAKYYIDILKVAKEAISYIIKKAIYSNEKFAFGCSAGKDRTGVVSAILLKSIGVKNEDIAKDYEVTAEYLVPKINDFEESWKKLNITKEDYLVRLKTKKETMLKFLNYFDSEYVSVESFLLTLNITSEEIIELKNKMINKEFL